MELRWDRVSSVGEESGSFGDFNRGEGEGPGLLPGMVRGRPPQRPLVADIV